MHVRGCLRTPPLIALKSLGGHRTIGLAPLTLLYGANSAGKTNLLQMRLPVR